MNMSKLWLPALLLGLVLLFEPAAARAAKQFTLQNSTGYPIDTVLVVQTYNGWRVIGWYTIQAYSYKNVTINEAQGQQFGYYGRIRSGGNAVWAGGGNEPTITIVNGRMNHDVRQQPYGNQQRRVKVRMRQGNSVRFTLSGSPQQKQTSGWW